jgi:hypothetical protein
LRSGLAVLTLIASLAARAAPTAAQDGRIVLEGGASRALPPAGVVGEAATYGVGGVRIEWSGARASLVGAGYGGRAADDQGSDFISGVLGGELWLVASAPIGIGIGGTLQAFAVDEPLLYRLKAGEVTPMVRLGGDAAALVVRGRFGAGTSRVELHRLDGTVRRAEHDLWTKGADAELQLVGAALALTATAGMHRSRGGDFGRGGVRLVAQRGAFRVRAEAELWDMPEGNEAVGGLSIAIPIGRLETRLSAMRTAPDPLTLVEPGTQSGVVLGLRLVSFGAEAPRATVHEVIRPGVPARVRIRVTPPEARTVEVLGDFDDWAPVALARDGGGWSVELDVEPGTHHFGFLVDGEWWIPEGLQGTVPDEWGRMNATMVVTEERVVP